MTAPFRCYSEIINPLQAYAPMRYRWWCAVFFLGWIGVCLVFAHYLVDLLWAGFPIAALTGAPLLLRLRQPAWFGVYSDGDQRWLTGGYTEMPNWQVPIEQIDGIWYQAGPLTGQIRVNVADRSAVVLHNRKGLSRGTLRENESRTGAAIHMDFFTAEDVSALDAMLVGDDQSSIED